MKSGESQIDRFFLVVELLQGGSATNLATPSDCRFLVEKKKQFLGYRQNLLL